MNGLTRIISIITGILFTGASILFFASNFFVAGASFKVAKTIHDIENPKDPFKRAKLDIVNHRIPGRKQFKPGYKEFAQFHKIEASRFVSFSAIVPIDQLLKKGETPPSASTENVFAKTRAIYYAREECERLLETIAIQCEVENAKGRIKDRMVTINGTMRFVQKTPLGDLNSDVTLSFETVSTQLVKSRVKTTAIGAPRQRQNLYRKAAAECAAIKIREGNCAITRINISTTYNSRSREMQLSGMANYAFLLEQ